MNITNINSSHYCKLLLLLIIAFCCIKGYTQDIYVSPKGNDNNSGTISSPFATLEHAKEIAKHLNSQQPENSKNLTIWLYGGKYVLSHTLTFNITDGAKPGQTITYRNMPNEVPVICSDIPVTNWKKYDGHPKGLPKMAEGKIWISKVQDDIQNFNMLYDSKGILPRSRTTALINLRTSTSPSVTGDEYLHRTLILSNEYLDSLFNPIHAEVSVIGYAGWTMNILPVLSINNSINTVNLAAKSSYILAKPAASYVPPQSIWVENTFAGLNEPGKWLYNPDEKLIYYWPKESTPGNDIVLPKLTELIKLDGIIDSSKDTPINGLIFKGLTFTHGNRFESSGLTGLGLQHDWERYDASTALLRFRGTEHCVVDACHFINSGGAGIRLDLYAQRDEITNNEIAQLGGVGILLDGYGPGKKDVNKNNIISNNLIHDIGINWWHSMAIFIWQSGHNLVAHNTLYNLPFIGIGITGRINWDPKGIAEASKTIRWSEIRPVVGGDPWDVREQFLHGRENIVEHNDISGILQKMNDGNAIYISGTGKGNIVRYNFIHDVPSTNAGQAIRCDDDQNETTIQSNVIYNFNSFGTAFSIKGRNTIINNIVASPHGAVRWGLLSIEPSKIIARNNELTGNETAIKKLVTGTVISHNIFYTNHSNQPFVNLDLLKQTIQGIKIDSNLYFNSSNHRAANQYLKWARSQGAELNSIQEDPLFEDISKNNFHVMADSPATKIGFIPFELDAGIKK